MKTKILALALFGATTVSLALYPYVQNVYAITDTPLQLPPINHAVIQQQPRIDVVFVLDTTGSMSGLIDAAKEKIWSIASTMAQAQPAPEIRIGLVAYRDRGDSYITRVVALSSDLDSVYARLMEFQADGGGDGPESVNQALNDAVEKMAWSQASDTYRAVFLVGDAPPHMDYQDDVKYPVTLATAKQLGIVVNAIQCGNDDSALAPWQRIARLGDGRYFQVDQAGSAVAVATPFDEKMAELSAQLDETRLYYGDRETKLKKQRKLEATDKLHKDASVASQARRAAFNSSASGKHNLLGEGELVDDVSSGRVKLDEIDTDYLPAPMQAMAPEEQRAVIKKKASERKSLQKEVKALAEKRSVYIREKVAEGGGAAGSLDDKLYKAVREQAAKVGMSYGEDAPAY